MLCSVNHTHQNGNTAPFSGGFAAAYKPQSCGAWRRTVRDDNRKNGYRIVATNRCGQCFDCVRYLQFSQLDDARRNIDAHLALRPSVRRYFLTFTLPPCSVADAANSFDEIRSSIRRVRAVLGDLLAGDVGRIEIKRINGLSIDDEGVCFVHVHMLLEMKPKFNSGKYYLGLKALDKLLYPVLHDRYDLSVASKYKLTDDDLSVLDEYGYENESGFYKLISYIFKGDVINEGDYELMQALKPILNGRQRRFASGVFYGQGLFNRVSFSGEGGAEAGEQVKDYVRNDEIGEYEQTGEHFHDPEAEAEKRRRNKERKERREQRRNERLARLRGLVKPVDVSAGQCDCGWSFPVPMPVYRQVAACGVSKKEQSNLDRLLEKGSSAKGVESIRSFDAQTDVLAKASKMQRMRDRRPYLARVSVLNEWENEEKEIKVEEVTKQKRTYVSLRVRFCFVAQLINGLGRVVTRTFYELPRPRDDCAAAANTEIYAQR